MFLYLLIVEKRFLSQINRNTKTSLRIYQTKMCYPIHYEKLVKFQIEIIIFQQYTINQLAKKNTGRKNYERILFN